MVSVQEAKQIIKANAEPMPPVLLGLSQLGGLVLSEDVFSPSDIPLFEQSNMDGYAIRFEDISAGHPFQIEGEVAAGQSKNEPIHPHQAIRIFTGAAVPKNADTVVMQEKTIIENGQLIIKDDNLFLGTNVRPKGSDMKAGQLALKKGSHLSPAAIGFLASMGITQAKVYPRPSITLLITGKEVRQPGQALTLGEINDANSFILSSALKQLQFIDVNMVFVDDDLQLVKDAMAKAILQSDLILVTGGVSVGDYDFVLEAANTCGVNKLFHSVKQKPGKPLYFGKKENKLVFGLPGNPSSVLTCFYEYVLPALEQMLCLKNTIKTSILPLAGKCSKKAGLTHFLKGSVKEGKVFPLDGQESYRLSSFASADCLIYLDEDKTNWEAGDLVEVHFLPS
jgi:molybdopterin molybdotransferase